ncbi:histone-lysine N-methyltransferase NSD3-like isoform X1 [Megalops cyprinoides]|uniref:histone-lysine N-methyltransferase NSD3-like isoform X1 n=1 Tax=Megalops cyprinoides TaxID=118141 RepID=UPI0018650C4F|nr:histone-lysine N-methyltransferase NSD3-like isoform X1 [Megalops cyprinoides]XP_036384463.1 histone-lysine N-methyltransferase NSD3-like isoform X1 [Megalops cyprinoides]
MDFSFSFMQGIMGNTIQQPPQLIDSANIRQEDTYDAGSDAGEEGGPSAYESALESGFSYPPEDLPVVTNGYPPGMGLYEPPTKYAMYSQLPNGSANGYSAIRSYGDHCLLPGEGTVLRPPVVQEKPPSPTSPSAHLLHHHHLHHPHPPYHHHHLHSPPPPPHHQQLPLPHLMASVLPPPPPLLLPSSPPPPSALDVPPPAATKKTSSPEIKLKIIKTYHNGRELFESSLCGDLLQEVQASEASRQRHERKKEKRKKRLEAGHGLAAEPERPQGGAEEPREQHCECSEDPLGHRQEQRPASSPSAEPKEKKVQKNPPSISSTGGCADHDVGDLVWAKVGTYPWWPCMVSCDPQLDVHMRINTRGHREYHVQFFGSVAERAWIHEKRVVVYEGREQFDELQAETLRKTTNPVERHKLLRPIPQRERSQWKVGIGHAEDALLMTREERIENYTFIYVDPSSSPPQDGGKSAKPERKARRSRSGGGGAGRGEETPPRRQQPKRQCSSTGTDEQLGPAPLEQEQGPPSPPSQDPLPQSQSPPVKTAWKTAAARKLLPLSITMKRLNVEITKCDWPLYREKVPSPRVADGDSKQANDEVRSPRSCSGKVEGGGQEPERVVSPGGRRSDQGVAQHASAEAPSGALERKQQRRSVRSRSESEKSADPVPKKKVKKEQAETVPQTDWKAGSQKGASEISDSCKPLKKRSRASTDVEMASSQYRDTSDSDSRGLSDPQVGFGKCADSPAAADADGSDTQSVDSSLSSQGSCSSKKDTVCQVCEAFGESLVSCEGDCNRLYHSECLALEPSPEGKFTCPECKAGTHACFSCKVVDGDVTRCAVGGCGRFYHESCARKHTGVPSDAKGLQCPQHSCATCRVERDLHKASKGRMMRCIRCPVAYHTGDGCVAAGSVVITPHIIICSNHSPSAKNGHASSPVNVGWCFVCARGLLVQDHTDIILRSYAYKSHYLLTESNRAELMKLPMIPSSSSATQKNVGKGGRLLCCEACPASFHPECLSMDMPEGPWLCNECRAGKKPHYKQIVWAKLGNYRWWPAEICSPRLVPFNIQTLKHDIGDFPVFFFGSHDYYWINQARVFPYVESDKNIVIGQIGINKTFKKALEEAARRFLELKAQRENKEALEQERQSRKPPPYKFIKSNKPVGKVQVHVADLSEIPRCNCKPTDENPCSLDSQCLNRMLQYECHPQVCPAGDRCHNQCFSKRLYPETEVIKTEGRGWGLKTKQDLKKGDFVTEYVGELIDSEECRQRIKRAHENRVTNFYMLTLTKDRVIDAGPKGNFSRFMNHSCSPNCETQKWTVNGDVRIGLFAVCDIEAETELTFNYNLDCLGNGRTSCQCGAENCSGFLGVRPKSAVVIEKEEKARNAKLKPKKRKVKPESKQVHEYFCFCCSEGGELVMCDKKDCPKAYHLLCLNLTKPPFGRWECPWHQCNVCQRPASSFCDFCPTSFCREHDSGVMVPSALDGRLCCPSHNPESPLDPESDQGKVKVKEEPPEPVEGTGE